MGDLSGIASPDRVDARLGLRVEPIDTWGSEVVDDPSWYVTD
ncbi:MAG: hypothetical protein JWP66_1860 [Naasia sp.]|nr:hypothetical protein [Naasia sp.]